MAGQEVLFCSVIDQLQSPQDSLVTVLHWNLISNGFKCCGIGDEVNFKKNLLLHYFHFQLSVCSQELAPILLLSVYNQCTAHLTITVEDFITNTFLLQLFIFICL